MPAAGNNGEAHWGTELSDTHNVETTRRYNPTKAKPTMAPTTTAPNRLRHLMSAPRRPAEARNLPICGWGAVTR